MDTPSTINGSTSKHGVDPIIFVRSSKDDGNDSSNGNKNSSLSAK